MVNNFISNLPFCFQSENEEGQTLVEYSLLIGLIAIIITMSLLFLGPLVSQMFQNVGTTLNGA